MGWQAYINQGHIDRCTPGLYRLVDLARWTGGAPLFAPLSGRFTFTTGLGAFVVCAASGLGEYAILLNLAVETFEGLLKRVTGVNFYFTHGGYQRDLRSLLRPVF